MACFSVLMGDKISWPFGIKKIFSLVIKDRTKPVLFRWNKFFLFFKRWPSLGEHFFDHPLWSIFQSSLHIQSQYATNWAILAWIMKSFYKLCILKQLKKLGAFFILSSSLSYGYPLLSTPLMGILLLQGPLPLTWMRGL